MRYETNRTVIPEHLLEKMRGLGDPELDDDLQRSGDHVALLAAVSTMGLPHAIQTREIETDTRWEHWIDRAAEIDSDPIDEDAIAQARTLFARYGSEIAGALLLAALPQAYAAEWGSRVLVATSEMLGSGLSQRISGTAQFLFAVMAGDQWHEDGKHYDLLNPNRDAWFGDGTISTPIQPWEFCAALRVHHSAIRASLHADKDADRILGDRNTTPLNQEDLLATLLSFSITPFEVLESFGIAWTAEEQLAYLRAWDAVGTRIGIATPEVMKTLKYGKPEFDPVGWHGLRPAPVADSRALLHQLQRRQWPAPGPTPPWTKKRASGEGARPPRASPWHRPMTDGTRPGRLLMRSLLDQLTRSMPPYERLLPITVIRQLAPPVVRARLNLGGGGIVTALLDHLPEQELMVDRFTVERVPNKRGARALRLMANEVTRRATFQFLEDGRLLVPGLESWSASLVDREHGSRWPTDRTMGNGNGSASDSQTERVSTPSS